MTLLSDPGRWYLCTGIVKKLELTTFTSTLSIWSMSEVKLGGKPQAWVKMKLDVVALLALFLADPYNWEFSVSSYRSLNYLKTPSSRSCEVVFINPCASHCQKRVIFIVGTQQNFSTWFRIMIHFWEKPWRSLGFGLL